MAPAPAATELTADQRQHSDGREFVEQVGLDDQRRTRLPVIALHGDHDEITALHLFEAIPGVRRGGFPESSLLASFGRVFGRRDHLALSAHLLGETGRAGVW